MLEFPQGEERTYLLQRNPKCKAGVSRLVQSFLEPKILSLLPFQMLKGEKKKIVVKAENKGTKSYVFSLFFFEIGKL